MRYTEIERKGGVQPDFNVCGEQFAPQVEIEMNVKVVSSFKFLVICFSKIWSLQGDVKKWIWWKPYNVCRSEESVQCQHPTLSVEKELYEKFVEPTVIWRIKQ